MWYEAYMSSEMPTDGKHALDVGTTRLPDALVHFVGRARGGWAPVPVGVPQTAEERTASILLTRCLLASKVPSSGESRVVCASDVSAAELEAAFDRGINRRGAFQPWAVVISRTATYLAGNGMRPVHYVDHSRAEAYRSACESIDGPGWGGLVVPIRLESYFNSVSDWMHEREWRWCAPPGQTGLVFDLRRRIKVVITGVRGWQPEWTVPALFAKLVEKGDTEYTIARWFWDPDSRCLLDDGTLTVPALPLATGASTATAEVAKSESEDAMARDLVQLVPAGVAGQESAPNSERPAEASMNPEKILVDAGGPGAARWQLHCPQCGSDAIDRSVGDSSGPDHEAVTIQPDRDGYESPIGTRGGYVNIALTCSRGHGFALVIANHKGAEFIGVVQNG